MPMGLEIYDKNNVPYFTGDVTFLHHATTFLPMSKTASNYYPNYSTFRRHLGYTNEVYCAGYYSLYKQYGSDALGYKRDRLKSNHPKLTRGINGTVWFTLDGSPSSNSLLAAIKSSNFIEIGHIDGPREDL